MLEKNNTYKVVKVFLDSPTDSFRLREISRLSKISPPSVMIYLKKLENDGLIKKQEKRGIPFYLAMRDSPLFVLYKKISILFELNSSGTVDYLWEKTAPEAIVLYGSFSRGESTEDSDIDIFVLGPEKKINLENFEEKLGRKIHILFHQSLKDVPKELRNNILNGMILKGYLAVY